MTRCAVCGAVAAGELEVDLEVGTPWGAHWSTVDVGLCSDCATAMAAGRRLAGDATAYYVAVEA